MPNFTFNWEKLRLGQRQAINTIRSRVRAREPFTSIVLPTRYGKSDVARLATLQMMSDGTVSNGLIVAPATNLVEQLLDESRLEASSRYYGFSRDVFFGVQTINNPPRLTRLKRSPLSSITTHMANLHIPILQQWVNTMIADPSGPRLWPVVFMDEAHLASDSNRWGNIAETLANAGAHVVVMTATPYRQDGRPIPGFDRDRYVLETTSEGGERVVYDLEPHWETTLQQAMEEDPPPIAQITYQPFGIRGRLENIDDATVDRIVLDDLDDADIRRAYRESLRNDAVMEDAIRFFLTELGNRRRDPRQAKVAGIIFVGNHESEFDNWENEHAVRVKTFLNQLSPRLRCEIIVSSDPSAQNLLDEFLGEKVDVAIVKQMGAIGLDAPHLKVALDLSNTRSRAYFLQRIMRIATRWEPDGFEHDPVLWGTYIAPDDRITRQRVQDVFEGTGVLRPTTEGNIPASGPIDIPPIDPVQGRLRYFVAEDVVLTGDLRDFDGTEAPATYIPIVDSLRNSVPETSGAPKAALAAFFQQIGVDPDTHVEAPDLTPSQAPADPEPTTTLNITKRLDDERKKVSDLGKKAINVRFRRSYSNYKQNRAEYGKVAAQFWGEHFRQVGLPSNHKLELIDDVETLRIIRENIESELRRRPR